MSSGYRVYGLGFKGFRVLGFGVRILGFRVRGSGLRIQGSWLWVSAFRVLGFMI
jgi:hypothetical protein